MRPLLCVLLLLVLAAACSAEDTYEYDYGYGDTYGYDEGELDAYGYYGNDDDAYYEEFGTYSDTTDGFGYDEDYDYLDEGISGADSCTTTKEGKVQLTNGTASCDLKLSGVNSMADKLKSGLDGIYKLSACHNGRPMYKRKDSPAGEERVLWYSKSFADWDISRGDKPNDKDILVYGTDAQQHVVPLFVQLWHLGADLTTKKPNGTSDETYVPVKLTLTCADGKKVKAPPAPVSLKVGPILTDDEMEAKYKMIYEKYGRRPEPNPTINLTFVTMLVLMGLTVVLAIPYMLVKRSKPGSRGYEPVATSFVQAIQQSRKKQSGHVH
jgi:iron-regulated transporter 1